MALVAYTGWEYQAFNEWKTRSVAVSRPEHIALLNAPMTFALVQSGFILAAVPYFAAWSLRRRNRWRAETHRSWLMAAGVVTTAVAFALMAGWIKARIWGIDDWYGQFFTGLFPAVWWAAWGLLTVSTAVNSPPSAPESKSSRLKWFAFGLAYGGLIVALGVVASMSVRALYPSPGLELTYGESLLAFFTASFAAAQLPLVFVYGMLWRWRGLGLWIVLSLAALVITAVCAFEFPQRIGLPGVLAGLLVGSVLGGLLLKIGTRGLIASDAENVSGIPLPAQSAWDKFFGGWGRFAIMTLVAVVLPEPLYKFNSDALEYTAMAVATLGHLLCFVFLIRHFMRCHPGSGFLHGLSKPVLFKLVFMVPAVWCFLSPFLLDFGDLLPGWGGWMILSPHWITFLVVVCAAYCGTSVVHRKPHWKRGREWIAAGLALGFGILMCVVSFPALIVGLFASGHAPLPMIGI